MAHGWRIQESMEDWMRNTDKKIAALERRPVVQQPSDIMGPTLGPYVQAVTDCNAAVTAVSGFFYVPIGTPNAPSSTLGWMVQTIAQADGYGIQIAYPEHDSTGGLTTGVPRFRRFWAPGASVPRIFASWDGDSGWFVPSGGLQNGFQNLDPSSFDTFAIRKIGGVVHLRGMLNLGTRTSGTVIFQLPAGFRPGGTSTNVRTHQAVTAGNTIAGDQRINIWTLTGGVEVNALSPTASDWFSFTGMSFPSDA